MFFLSAALLPLYPESHYPFSEVVLMKNLKLLAILVLAMFSISFAFAWLGTPTDAEKAYFKDSLKNMSEKEFSGFGVALSGNDLQLSIYVYKRQTLTADEWSNVFKDAFNTNPANWTQAYDWVLARINESSYYETFGYLNMNNRTYWLENVDVSNEVLDADINSTDNSTGRISMSPLFWSFWTGSADIDGTEYRIVLLKMKN